MDMETPAPTPVNDNINENEMHVNLGSDTYKIIIFIELDKLVIKLESIDDDPDKMLYNNFNFAQFQNFHNIFKGCPSIEAAKDQLLAILKMVKPQIQKNEQDFTFNINIFGANVSIPLKKIDKEHDFCYDSLSEEMKKIIDKGELIIGIDLGTTYSCASIMLDEHIIIIENSLGQRTTPSYLCFLEPNEICTGELAKLQPSYEYKNIVYNTKRLLGRNINDKEIKEILPDLPFDLMQDEDLNQLKININFKTKDGIFQKEYYPEQISALILKKLITDSENYLMKKLKKHIVIKNAVITVPAYFNQKQREATYQAAKIINLNVKRMINEPTAASLAYGYKQIENNNKLITVLDFGGGTLDLTLLQFIKNKNGVYCDIKFSYGDTHFGGEDFDYILMKKCLESVGQNEFDKKLQCNIRLKRACELAKIKLSTADSTNIILEEYSKDTNINFTVTNEQFEEYCAPIFNKFEQLLHKFLDSCGYNYQDISEVILIGGTTLMPKVESIIKNVFKDSEIKKNLNPNEAVARGAAIQAAMLSDLSPVKNMSLLDVTNLSLGVKMVGNKMSKIIKRSTPIPEEVPEIYKTVADNQTQALIEIFEGEDDSTINNLCLGKFTIYNLPKMKKGEAKIKVYIKIDNDSILNVTAYDMQNENNYKQLLIKRPKGLSDKLDQLREETENIEEIELEEYIIIRDIIMDLEEEITNTNDNGQKQEITSKLINNLGEFIMNIIKNKKIEKEKIVLSYIKYYFIKVVRYLEGNNEEEKIITNFDYNLNLILEEIQFNSTDLIFEIIEIFVDNKKLYSKCLLQLLNHYYEKIANTFYEINILLTETPNDYDKAFDILRELKEQIKHAQKFCEEPTVNDDNKKKIISLQKSIKDLSLQIDVKEVIIRNRQEPIDFNVIGEKEKLEKLLEEYQQCKNNDAKDLIDLESIIKKSNLNITNEQKKAYNFLQIFNKMKEDDHEKFLFIFEKYNLTKYYEITDLLNLVLNPDERYNLLVELCSKYQKYANGLNPGAKKDAITQIQIYLNHLKKKSENKDDKLFTTLDN